MPALLQNGLLAHSRDRFSMPEGYYRVESIFLVLAFMALARIPSLEALRYEAPGEWGKLMGLDRIPEVRTLRAMLSALCSQKGQAALLEREAGQRMDGRAGERERRGVLRRWSRAGLSWFSDQVAAPRKGPAFPALRP